MAFRPLHPRRMILSYRDKRTERFGRGQVVRVFPGLNNRRNGGSPS
jgi:hypothetical protein